MKNIYFYQNNQSHIDAKMIHLIDDDVTEIASPIFLRIPLKQLSPSNLKSFSFISEK